MQTLSKVIEDYLIHVNEDHPFTNKLREYLQPETRAASRVTLKLHDHIHIFGENQFQGFTNFSVYANAHYRGGTKLNRERFDCVEIAIESSMGGGVSICTIHFEEE